MKTWLIVGTVATVVGLGFYLVAGKRPAPAPMGDISDIAINVAVAQPPAPAPVYLDRVVDVSDLDSLLDPPPIPVSEPRTETGPVITRVGYEEPASPTVAGANVPPIPKSIPEPRIIVQEDEEITESEETQPISVESFIYSPDQGIDWESEFRPGPDGEWLDRKAAKSILFPESRAGQFMMDEGFKLVREAISHPLAPLFLGDSDLIQATSRDLSTPGLFPVAGSVDSQKAIVRRAYDIFHVANQRPDSRLNWYTRWYGDGQIPRQIGTVLTPTQIHEMLDHPKSNYLQQRYRDVELFF